jgi:hypothetical protein
MLATTLLLLAAASSMDEMRVCAAEKNDGARLACYDRAMAVPAPAAPAPPAPVPAPPKQVAPADEFGMTEDLRRKRSPDETKPALPQELRAKVVSVERGRGDALRVKLDNGQVWAETERKPVLVLKTGDAVTIRSGVLGSFFLTLDSGVATRVKRVQ